MGLVKQAGVETSLKQRKDMWESELDNQIGEAVVGDSQTIKDKCRT